MEVVCAAALLLTASGPAFAVYDDAGRPSDLGALCHASEQADVVYLGEVHTDSVAHVLQLDLFEGMRALAQEFAQDRPVALGLEMFETDVQPVLDEYLAGLIEERDFLAASRPWANYATDYRPLVEAARGYSVPVLATNAPARYVRRLSRDADGGLAVLPDDALRWLPPLPIAPPSAGMEISFRGLMEGMPSHGGPSVDGMLAAQNLRDASMADVVATWLAQNPGGLVVHINGSFHSQGGRGIPEHLARRAPGVRQLTVEFRPTTDLDAETIDAEGHDFVILTRAEG